MIIIHVYAIDLFLVNIFNAQIASLYVLVIAVFQALNIVCASTVTPNLFQM